MARPYPSISKLPPHHSPYYKALGTQTFIVQGPDQIGGSRVFVCRTVSPRHIIPEHVFKARSCKEQTPHLTGKSIPLQSLGFRIQDFFCIVCIWLRCQGLGSTVLASSSRGLGFREPVCIGFRREALKQLQLSILEGMRDAASRCLSVWGLGLGFVVLGDLKDSRDLVIMIDGLW